MHEQRLELINPLGLHARAAAKLVGVAQSFGSTIHLKKSDGGDPVDGKSIMSVLLLAAPVGSVLLISCVGEDEDAAGAAIRELFEAGFYELEDT